MVYQISIGLIAIAFTVLAVYVILTLKSVRQSLNKANETLQNVSEKMDELSGETVILLKQSQEITSDVRDKIKALDHLFQSANQVGEAVHQVSSSVKQVSATVSQSLSSKVVRPIERNRQSIEDVGNWLLTGVQLWNRFRSQKKKGEEEYDRGE